MAETPPILEEDAEAAWELFVFGAQEPPLPAHGDAESAGWIRAQLQELGFTQGSFARWMQRRGDVRPRRNIQRSIQRICAGQARVPGEMRVLLGLMLRSKRRKTARAARERDEREAPWNDLYETRSGRGESGEPEATGADSSETRRGREERDVRGARPGVSSEERRERRKPDAGEATGDASSETRLGHGERHGRDAPPGDLSETRLERAERDAGEASKGDSAEKHRGQEYPDGRDAPPRYSFETRAEQAPDSKMVRQ